MINPHFPSDGHLFRSNKPPPRLDKPPPIQYSSKDRDPSKVVSDSICAPPTTGGPWTLYHDQQERPFWSNATGQWLYPGATDIAQPPPPPMKYISQAPQQPVWVASPPAVQAPFAVPGSPTSSSPQTSWVGEPSWERLYDATGRSVWIHTKTRRLVHDDPYG